MASLITSSPYIEAFASYLFANSKSREDSCFTKSKAFDHHPKPTIHVVSPNFPDDEVDDEGRGHELTFEYMAGEKEEFPELDWDDGHKGIEGVQEWLVVVEDPDAPLPTPVCHGIYLGIPKDKTNISNDDLKVERHGANKLRGGFYYGESRNGKVYIPPHPLLNHGVHRYFYDVIALSEPIDKKTVLETPTRDAVASAIEGKVLAWGRWVGECERRWE